MTVAQMMIAQILQLMNEEGHQVPQAVKQVLPVREMADISLFTSSTKEAAFRSAATSSRLAQLHMIDILFMYVASQDYEQSVKFLDETREAIHTLSKKVSRSERGKGFFRM
ncbi:hypothetical protein [Chryseomicrobium palamuruense]